MDATTSSERAIAKKATKIKRDKNIFILLWVVGVARDDCSACESVIVTFSGMKRACSRG